MSSKEDRAKQIWKSFRSNGFSPEATAGILGNLEQETSTFDPTLEGYNNAYGIFQFDPNGALPGYKSYCNKENLSISAIDSQVKYVIKLLPSAFKSYTGGNYWHDYTVGGTVYSKPTHDRWCRWGEESLTIDDFKSISGGVAGAEKAAEIFCRVYERAGLPRTENRKKYAKSWYNKLKTTSSIQKRFGPEDVKYSKVGILKWYKQLSSINPFEINLATGGNCTWYAWGRFQELAGKKITPVPAGNAYNWVYSAKASGILETGKEPRIGAIICWGYNGSPLGDPGHVAIVEDIKYENGKASKIEISQSGWSSGPLANKWITRDDSAPEGKRWDFGYNDSYFNGFIYNPEISFDTTSHGGAGGTFDEGTTGNISYDPNEYKGLNDKFLQYFGGPLNKKTYKQIVQKEKVITTKVTGDSVYTVDNSVNLQRTKTTSLLSYPSLVESPFVIAKIGKYSFGTSNAVQSGNTLKVEYPNFIKDLSIVKVNGNVNQYTLTLVYQIAAGDDPNFVDKVLSSVGYGKIKLSYGDWMCPSFIYKEEEALITNVTNEVDFASSKIVYRVSAVSSCLPLAASTFNFPAYKSKKPSDLIRNMLYGKNNTKYGLLEAFPGLRGKSKELSKYIPTDDRAVKLEAKEQIDPISYINYLVSCMVSDTNSKDAVILDSSYYLTIHDDVYSEFGGTYFKITKVSSKATMFNANTYEVDIGYPSENLVTKFSVNSQNSWSLLYNYSDKIKAPQYKYKVADNGEISEKYVPGLVATSGTEMSSAAKNWWTQMTQFPISANLTIKGLIRPAMLMTYLRVNAFFYGQRHIASGLYIITRQEDVISGQGYRTNLTLTRIAGDTDYIKRETKEVKTKVVENIVVEKTRK